jgi:hypothetical protein
VWIIHYIIFKFAVSGHNARVHREERDRGSHIDGDA